MNSFCILGFGMLYFQNKNCVIGCKQNALGRSHIYTQLRHLQRRAQDSASHKCLEWVTLEQVKKDLVLKSFRISRKAIPPHFTRSQWTSKAQKESGHRQFETKALTRKCCSKGKPQPPLTHSLRLRHLYPILFSMTRLVETHKKLYR